MSELGSSYLFIAERVLLQARRPLRPPEILDQALLHGILPPHLYGRTQHKTLHARLSEDISRRLEHSRFFRTGPGLFFLNVLKNDPGIPESYKAIFRAPQRRKELRREKILTMFWPHSSENLVTKLSVADIRETFRQGRFAYLAWKDLSVSHGYLPIHSFVVVHRDDQILSFRSGKFTSHSDPLQGTRSIGFGRTVFATDLDMLYDSFFGIVASAISELAYGLGLPSRLAEDARYENLISPVMGTIVLSSKTNRPHIHIVLSYRCPSDFTPTQRALSLNDLRWVWSEKPANRLNQFDLTSQFLIEQGYMADILAA
jgi:hypothetical protein